MADPLPFRFRLNCVDHYQATPTAFDPQLFGSSPSQQKNGSAVPVIRAFGATETGQKVCAHIHGALPYLYLEYTGPLTPDAVQQYIRDLRLSTDHALAVSYRRNAYDGKATYVGHISLVKGVPFFGYHVGFKFFLKVYLLNPVHMTRFADLLHQGAIMGRVLQPYEAHLQYLLQWMCDYNLYGCAYVDCANVRFRAPVPDFYDLKRSSHRWHDRSIGPELISEQDTLPRQSHCDIEIDVRVEDILNRNEVQERTLHQDFLERFIQLGPEDKFVNSMAGLWKDETKRRKRRMGLTDPSSSPFPPEVLVSMSADARSSQKGGWIHEEEYREMIAGLIKAESLTHPQDEVGFDTFVKPHEFQGKVQSAWDSLEELFSTTLSSKPDPNALNSLSQVPPDLLGGVVVDESRISFEEPKDEPMSDDDAVDAPMQALDQGLEDMGQYNGGPSVHTDRIKSRLPGSQYIRSPKRRRIDEHGEPTIGKASSSPTRKVAFVQGQALSQPTQRSLREHSSQEKLSQPSIKSAGGSPNKMSFPSVKNPHDPDTAFRLSQRSERSASQQKTTPSKAGAENGIQSLTTTTPSVGRTVLPSGSDSSRSLRSLRTPVSSQVLRFASAYSTHARAFLYFDSPPTASKLQNSLLDIDVPPVIYQDAHYSLEKDVPERPREYAGREFRLESTTTPYLPAFDPTGTSLASVGEKAAIVVDKGAEELTAQRHRRQCGLRNWQYAQAPPTQKEVEQWMLQTPGPRDTPDADARVRNAPAGQKTFTRGGASGGVKHTLMSQIEGPTQKSKHGFKYSQKEKTTSVQHETQYMSIMSLEIHANSRGTLVPDPNEDAVAAIFWCIGSDDGGSGQSASGILALSDEDGVAARIAKQVSVPVEHEQDELDLINRMVDIVREHDPDILTGFEVHNNSWGYLIERARVKYEYNLCDEFSRMKAQSHGRFGKEADRWGFTHTSTIRVTGRHMINVWRAMRGELNLLQYTLENIVFHLLHKRVPHYSYADLSRWYQSDKPRDLSKVISYFLTRMHLNLEILEANELVARISEQARLLGVDFFSVISRGSQFKVESLMFRIAKPENFILVSPSRKQVGQQNALECLPLVMEPQSAFYNSPLLVLDFQSLYPSVMIAYNICYSTCLGRVVPWRGANKLGFTDFHRAPRLLELVKDHVNVAPNGLMFVRPDMRKSLLAKMLGEILETRVMVKSGMKVDRDDKTLQALLNNRQLALKLIANVTYGYTSASFSGRMPASEIADSIVQTGRETLEKAIALIHSVTKWGAEVVYGDTDSLFVYLKGRTKDEAFKIGNEIAEAVTKTNPRPVKLKFEKVYHPCVLLAKKRYVGFKYESPQQQEPEFDAKGIETVRRDGTPAEQKLEEKALKILFRSQDLSEVKQYFQEQCAKLMAGKVSVQDFLFAKEVKLGTYSDKGPPPPGALIATRRMLNDPRTEPQYGERVPYVVITGAPGARLIDRCVDPEVLLKDNSIELDAEYYISKNWIPPLERIFNLVGANVRGWYDEMPKLQRIRNIRLPQDVVTRGAPGPGRKTLEGYMKSSACIVCRTRLPSQPSKEPEERLPLCEDCISHTSSSLVYLRRKAQRATKRLRDVEDVCRSCSNLPYMEQTKCDSRDCPVFYTRTRQRARARLVDEGIGAVIAALEQAADDGLSL